MEEDNTDTQEPTPIPKEEFSIIRHKIKRPYVGMIYGPPGVGKTTLASSIHNSVVIDIERGSDAIEGDKILIDDTDSPSATIAKIKRAIAFAAKEGAGTIVIDSATSLQSLFEKDFLMRSGKTSLDTGNFGQDYGFINDAFKAFLGGQSANSGTMRYLKDREINLILIAHAKDKTDTVGDSKLLHTIVPSLYTGMVSWLSIQLDFIFYYTHDIVVKEETLGMTKSKLSATRGRKIITCQEGGIMAKNRYGLKPIISNPTLKLFTEIWS